LIENQYMSKKIDSIKADAIILLKGLTLKFLPQIDLKNMSAPLKAFLGDEHYKRLVDNKKSIKHPKPTLPVAYVDFKENK